MLNNVAQQVSFGVRVGADIAGALALTYVVVNNTADLFPTLVLKFAIGTLTAAGVSSLLDQAATHVADHAGIAPLVPAQQNLSSIVYPGCTRLWRAAAAAIQPSGHAPISQHEGPESAV